MSVVNRTYKVVTTIFSKKYVSYPKYLFQTNLIRHVNEKKSIFKNNLHTSNYINTKIQFNLSDIGEGIREVVVKEWFVKVGDKVSQFDNICEVQSDKASVTITSRYDGIITKLYYDVDYTALVGKPLIEIDAIGVEEGAQPTETEVKNDKDIKQDKPITPESTISDTEAPYNMDLCIPSVRRLAKEHNIDLFKVTGTGKKGRILKEDVLKYMDSMKVTSFNTDRVEPIRGFQKAMFKTMTDSLKIPHFVYSDEIKVTKLSKLRYSIKEETKKHNLKISFMPFFIKAASNALDRYPILNATLDENCENVIYKVSHNIGVAMDTKMGLAVPVIKSVDKLTILEIATELSRLLKSGKEGNFTTNDLAGATFTISNIGMIGGTYTKPVIMPPQVAIIAVGSAKVVPRFDNDGNVVPEEIISLSGAADHRIVDGATMAHFVNVFKKQIENPYLLFLNI